MRVAIATCRVLPEPDPDQAPLLDALAGLGVEATLLPWDSSTGSSLDGIDLCVIRSIWNYYQDRAAFLAWAKAASARTRLENPLPVLRWNTPLMVMELELCEPSLFLLQHPPALARFAGAIRDRVSRRFAASRAGGGDG